MSYPQPTPSNAPQGRPEAIRCAWRLHHQFTRACSSRRDVPMPPVEGERLLSPYIERWAPQGPDALSTKRPGEVLAAAWLRRCLSPGLTPAQIEVRRRLGVLMDPLQAARHLAQAEALRRGGVR